MLLKMVSLLGKAFLSISSLEGESIFDEYWDFLLILDACRFDTFSKIVKEVGIEGELRKMLSKGSNTSEWFSKNFSGKYPDIIYINSNPVVTNLIEKRKVEFFHVENVWVDGWDEEHSTVLPETLIDRFFELYPYYPMKRYIIHFLQPHFPYLSMPEFGKKAMEMAREGKWKRGIVIKGINLADWEFYLSYRKEEWRKAYEENLRYVLKVIKEK
ncbi:hypothetical protein J7L81_04625, partial [Candidatus Aerophobetes bacterium]|nr:hypothetical protein [Candidatus Aerophobetes bacterium]